MAASQLIAQACAIPYRVVGGRLEFCLITSIRNGRWGFPKGIIEPGETAEEAALKEAHEEAGLHGHLVGPALRSYYYKKWGATLHVTVFLMQVTDVDTPWQEAAVRKRCFCAPSDAGALLGDSPQAASFADALSRWNLGAD